MAFTVESAGSDVTGCGKGGGITLGRGGGVVRGDKALIPGKGMPLTPADGLAAHRSETHTTPPMLPQEGAYVQPTHDNVSVSVSPFEIGKY
ncbi:MAG: hypothetical protein R3D44_11050 [Hyphomicrobiaceae bacterium]